jgi:hypothetical protein
MKKNKNKILNTNLQILITVIIAIIIIIAIIFAFGTKKTEPNGNHNLPSIASFDDCVNAGYPVMESYPRQCKVPDGQSFTEDIGNRLDKIDLIRLDNPQPNQQITSPLNIMGEAKGTWFFEAQFPVKIYDSNDNLLVSGIAQAQGEWMTEKFVPFVAKLEFTKPATSNGYLILGKDNPSGLPENSDQLKTPIKF